MPEPDVRTLLTTLVTVLAVGLLSTACARENDVAGQEAPGAPAPAAPSPTLRTIPALPVLSEPPTGELSAFMQQSSIDVARGQFQVVLVNDTRRDLEPTGVHFRDPRLGVPLTGGNLRLAPSQSERGFPFPLPAQPPCAADRDQPTSFLLVTHDGRRERVPVEDESDVVGRFLATRCQELALAEAVTLSWSDDVPVDHPGLDGVATLTLVVRPTGADGHRVRIDGVNGSHLLGSRTDPTGWSPGVRVASNSGVTRRIALPLSPTRCDDHAFMEGGNATAFRVRFTLDGDPGEILLRMSPTGSSAAIHFAQDSCGLA